MSGWLALSCAAHVEGRLSGAGAAAGVQAAGEGQQEEHHGGDNQESANVILSVVGRSEERRVWKECRYRLWPDQ